MSTQQQSEMIIAFKGQTTIRMSLIRSFYIEEIWIPAPYNLTLNMFDDLGLPPSLRVFPTREARFDRGSEIQIPRAVADQYLKYVADKAELAKQTTYLEKQSADLFRLIPN